MSSQKTIKLSFNCYLLEALGYSLDISSPLLLVTTVKKKNKIVITIGA